MDTESSKTVKLLIEEKMVPMSVVLQLVQWKLLPEGFLSRDGEHGTRKRSPDEFVRDLKIAIQEDTSTIRETDLDRIGGFRPVQISTKTRDVDTVFSETTEHFVDRMGRVILPVRYNTELIKTISVDGGPTLDIIRVEPRFEGEQQVAWVCYLADKGETNAEEVVTKDN